MRLSPPDADGNRTVSVDADGPGGAFAPIEIATLVQPTGVTSVEDLVGGGNDNANAAAAA